MKTDFRKTLRGLAERIDAMTLRERGIIFVTVLVLLYFVASTLVLTPLRSQQQRLGNELKVKREQVAALNVQIQKIVHNATRDVDKENTEKLKLLRERIVLIDPRLAGMSQSLVSPRDMARFVEQVLTRNRALQVIRLESLAPAPVEGQAAPATGKAAAVPAASSGVHRHGMRIEVRGRYADLVNYLRALEAMPWKVFWGQVTLESEDHPMSKLTLVIYTLSLQPGWIGL